MRALLVLCALLALASPGAACECPGTTDREDEPGVLWRGQEPIGLVGIAGLAAPILWYSSDEPLLISGERQFLPDPHPCDEQVETGVVYYQATELRLRSDARVTLPPEEDTAFFDKVDNFLISYYFYYRRDIGLEPHTHDIEVTQMHVFLDREADGCKTVRVSTVVGLAHGVYWYNNILKVEADTRWPMVILVEEGKHASCPDRNADGIYTPGYDVNHRVNDAWGVRDVLSTGFLSGARYHSAMTKGRELQFRMLPPEVPERCPSRPSRASASAEMLGRYALRPADRVPACAAVSLEKEDAPDEESPEARVAREDRQRIGNMMEEHHFGRTEEPDQFPVKSLKNLAPPITSPSRWIPSVSLRHDGVKPAAGLSFIFPGPNAGILWAVPKINIMDHLGLDLMLTPSASRYADWYIAVGFDRFDAKTAEVDGEEVKIEDAVWDWATEAGVKFRFRVPAKIKPFLLTYDFGGVRLGMRNNGFDNLDNFRLIAEIGAGAW